MSDEWLLKHPRDPASLRSPPERPRRGLRQATLSSTSAPHATRDRIARLRSRKVAGSRGRGMSRRSGRAGRSTGTHARRALVRVA